MIGLNEILPRHIAIIMDGNGRWAQNRGLLRIEGHRAGANTVKNVVSLCLRYHIPVLSLFAFSSENWLRPEEEISFLMRLFIEALGKEVQELHENGVCLQFIGDRSALSPLLQEQMGLAETRTKENKRLILNIVVNYGGKWDLVQAVKTIARKVYAEELNIEAINESEIAQALSTSDLPDPDLFIRTSGEQRISNFFLWQLAYTELYFADVYWPDFGASEFEKALASFRQRERRYGKTSQQLNEADHV